MSRNADDAKDRPQGNELVEDPVLGMRYRFSHEGEVLRNEITVDHGGGPPEHIHPGAEERFEVVEGDVTFWVGGKKVTSGPGDRHVVQPGVRHSFKNSGPGTALVVLEAQPPLALQAMFEDLAALSRAGKITRRVVPKGIGALLELADLGDRYREEIVPTGFPYPPPNVQRLVLPPLARLQRWRRRRAAG